MSREKFNFSTILLLYSLILGGMQFGVAKGSKVGVKSKKMELLSGL
jgi:hypothetical protein